MAAAIAFAERVSLWQEELQRIVVDARLLPPEARRAVGSVLRSLLLEACGDREEITALRTAIEVFDTPPATPSKAAAVGAAVADGTDPRARFGDCLTAN